jgi:hypothetical protein
MTSTEQLLLDKHLSWNFSGKFKLLGITFNLSESDKTLENFTDKVQLGHQHIDLFLHLLFLGHF